MLVLLRFYSDDFKPMARGAQNSRLVPTLYGIVWFW